MRAVYSLSSYKTEKFCDGQPPRRPSQNWVSFNSHSLYQFDCACGSQLCRTTIHPEDITKYCIIWDEASRDAYQLMRQVPQTLWELVMNHCQRDRSVARYMMDETVELPSCLEYYVPSEQIKRSLLNPSLTEVILQSA